MIPTARLTPEPLPEFDPSIVIDVDVRDDLRAGREPLGRILAAAETLPDGSVLHLRTPFQPTPLFGVLGRLGFEFHTERFADDDWSSWFWRGELPAPQHPADEPPLNVDGAWDLRGLPAPEPLQRLIERTASNAAPFDVLLPAYSDLLSSIIAQHGWHVEVVAASGGSYRVRLTRRTGERPER